MKSRKEEQAQIDAFGIMPSQMLLEAIAMELVMLPVADREELTSAIVGSEGPPPRLWFMLEHFFERFPCRSRWPVGGAPEYAAAERKP